MSGDRGAEIAFACLLVILPLSALIARRVPLGRTAKMAAAWLAIFVVGLLLANQRDRFAELKGLLSDQHVEGRITRIAMGEDGHFHADVVVNGVTRTMLIDSGATTTALSEATASAAGIALDDRPFPVLLDTANGSITARRDRADSHRRVDPHDGFGGRGLTGIRRRGCDRNEFPVEARVVAGRGTHPRPRTDSCMKFT